jgi:hypothetical protein
VTRGANRMVAVERPNAVGVSSQAEPEHPVALICAVQ